MENFFNKILDLFLGSKDVDGKIKYTRPLIISAILFLIVALLVYVTRGFFLIIILAVGCWSWIITNSIKESKILKQKEELLLLIMNSRINSTRQLGKHMGISYSEIETLLFDMIKSANSIKSGYIKKTTNPYVYLKNAHLNLDTHEIELDTKATNTFLDRVGEATNSVLDRFAPKRDIPKPDWKCHYCSSINKGDTYECVYCGAGKV